jgi:hypothetical protein
MGKTVQRAAVSVATLSDCLISCPIFSLIFVQYTVSSALMASNIEEPASYRTPILSPTFRQTFFFFFFFFFFFDTV